MAFPTRSALRVPFLIGLLALASGGCERSVVSPPGSLPDPVPPASPPVTTPPVPTPPAPGIPGGPPPTGGDGDWTLRTIDGSGGGADGADLADVDGDGDLDLATGREQSGQVRLYLNPGAAGPWPAITVCDACPHVEDAHLVDLDADGRVDVVSSHEGETKTVMLHFAPADPAAPWHTVDLPAAAAINTSWLTSASGQIDGRHGLDLVAGSKRLRGGVYWFAAPAGARDAAGWSAHRIAEAKTVMGLIVTDLDGDGDADVLVSDRSGDVSWFANPGPGAQLALPWPEHLIGTGTVVRWLALADLDGDGREDVVLADSHADGAVRWFQRPAGGPAGTWMARSIALTPGTPWDAGGSKSVAVGDVNRDGRTDLVVATDGDAHRTYWLSWRTSVFDAAWDGHLIFDQRPAKFDEVHLLDLDGDLDPDVLTTAENGGLGVLWFENPLR